MLKCSDLTEMETSFYNYLGNEDKALKLAIIELKRLGMDPATVLWAEIRRLQQSPMVFPAMAAA